MCMQTNTSYRLRHVLKAFLSIKNMQLSDRISFSFLPTYDTASEKASIMVSYLWIPRVEVLRLTCFYSICAIPYAYRFCLAYSFSISCYPMDIMLLVLLPTCYKSASVFYVPLVRWLLSHIFYNFRYPDDCLF